MQAAWRRRSEQWMQLFVVIAVPLHWMDALNPVTWYWKWTESALNASVMTTPSARYEKQFNVLGTILNDFCITCLSWWPGSKMFSVHAVLSSYWHAPCGPGAISTPYSFTSPHSTLFFSILQFSLSTFFTHFIYSFLLSHSTRLVPLHFQAGCRRRRLNLALVL